MNDIELIQEVRERLIRIEGKIENANDKHTTLEKRVEKLEGNNTWLVRAIVGQIVAAIMAFFMIKK